MPDLHELLDRGAAAYEPSHDLLARVHERRRQRERTRRIGMSLAGVVVMAVLVGGLLRVPPPRTAVVLEPPPDPWVGTWVSIDTDGSTQAMDIRAEDDGWYAIVVEDDAATVCASVPSTMTGTGRLDGAALVLPAPVLECADGSEPRPVDGSALEEALRDYTLVLDTDAAALIDSFDVRWGRPDQVSSAAPATPAIEGRPWPQWNDAQVREAQVRADAGDPDHTWQLAPEIVADTTPGDAQIFQRFLRERGWESSLWGDASTLYHGRGCETEEEVCTSHEVGFLRCAPGQTNALYPDDPAGSRCAPSIDAVTYEAVAITVDQLATRGPSGIWVVTDYAHSVLIQERPRRDAEVTALLDAFLQARIDGRDADAHVDPASDTIPLLYAASDGARYQGFEHEAHPVWPNGSFDVVVRLYTAGRGTVVEQRFTLDDADGTRLLLEFSHRTTTEAGEPLPEPYGIVDGEVTFRVAPPWHAFFDYGPNTVALDSGDQDEADFAVLADPLPVAAGCQQGPAAADVAALARSITSDPDLEVSEPVAAIVGGIEALQLDVVAAAGASVCADAGTPLVVSGPQGRGPFLGSGDRMRLYLLDLPEGSSARTLAIAFVAAEAVFDSVLEEAPPILQSFTFQTP